MEEGSDTQDGEKEKEREREKERRKEETEKRKAKGEKGLRLDGASPFWAASSMFPLEKTQDTKDLFL